MSDKLLSVLISPTMRCNLRCRYCYVDTLGAGDMTLDDFQAFYNWLMPYAKFIGAHRIVLSWFGGEPLMYGYDALNAALSCQQELLDAKEIPFRNGMQCNLTLVDDRICGLIERYFDNIISGSLEPHGSARVFPDGSPATKTIERKIAELRRRGIRVGVVCTLTRQDMVSPEEFFDYYKDRVEAVRVNRAHPPVGADPHDYLSVEEYVDYVIKLMDMFAGSKRPGFDFVNFSAIAKAVLAGERLECVSTDSPEWKIAVSGGGILSSCCRRYEMPLGSVYDSSPAEVVSAYRELASGKTSAPAKCIECKYHVTGICSGSCIGEPDSDCESAFCGYRTEYTAKTISRTMELMSSLGIRTLTDLDYFCATRH